MKDQILKSIVTDLEYLYSKIAWGESHLDAKAVKIMNEMRNRILSLELDPNIYNDN